jgi:hypothetical protein
MNEEAKKNPKEAPFKKKSSFLIKAGS